MMIFKFAAPGIITLMTGLIWTSPSHPCPLSCPWLWCRGGHDDISSLVINHIADCPSHFSFAVWSWTVIQYFHLTLLLFWITISLSHDAHSSSCFPAAFYAPPAAGLLSGLSTLPCTLSPVSLSSSRSFTWRAAASLSFIPSLLFPFTSLGQCSQYRICPSALASPSAPAGCQKWHSTLIWPEYPYRIYRNSILIPSSCSRCLTSLRLMYCDPTFTVFCF